MSDKRIHVYSSANIVRIEIESDLPDITVESISLPPDEAQEVVDLINQAIGNARVKGSALTDRI